MYGVLHLTGLDDRIHRQQFDLQGIPCHRINAIDIGFYILQKDAAAPGCLHFQGNGGGLHYTRRGNGTCSSSGCCERRTFQNLRRLTEFFTINASFVAFVKILQRTYVTNHIGTSRS